eukprot:SAG31_NODE_45548_length_258_cov_0.962264_1_plen_44_part_01
MTSDVWDGVSMASLWPLSILRPTAGGLVLLREVTFQRRARPAGF